MSETMARAMIGALDGRHPDVVASYLDDVSLLHVAGTSGFAGDYQGREAILGVLGRMAELTDGTLSIGPAVGTLGGEEAVVLHGTMSATREGRMLDTDVTLAVTTDADRLREVWVSHSDQQAFDSFWS